MKVLILNIIVVFFLLATLAFAKLEDYTLDIVLGADKKVSVKALISFSEPTERFDWTIFGKIENFNVTAPKPIFCDLKVGEVSIVGCLINFTEKETLRLSFDSYDFIKVLDNKHYFSADFSLGKEIKRLYAVIRLPEGMVLAKEEILPLGGKISSDGRRIIVIWDEENIPSVQTLKFQLVYEQTSVPAPPTIYAWQFVIVALVAIILPTYFVVRLIRRKPEKIILSVLDKFERKVIDVLIATGGKATQKKVVQQTGLSKAKVSRVVKVLAERKLITVERLGRTNILKLSKLKFKI